MTNTEIAAPTATPKPRKPRRIFMWTFFTIQAIFLIWIITGLATKTGPSSAQIAQFCGHGAWSPLFKSYHDCVVHGANGLTAAGDLGKGIAVIAIIGFWVAVDVILGIGRFIVVTARRRHAN